MKIYFSFRVSQKGNVFVGLLIIAGILIFGIWYLRSGGSPLNRKDERTPKTESQRIAAGKTYTIEITSKGFLPEHVTLKPYDKLTFVNKDIKPHQPTSNDCPELDAKKELIQNETYSAVFVDTKTCDFSDARDLTFSGQVIVAEK